MDFEVIDFGGPFPMSSGARHSQMIGCGNSASFSRTRKGKKDRDFELKRIKLLEEAIKIEQAHCELLEQHDKNLLERLNGELAESSVFIPLYPEIPFEEITERAGQTGQKIQREDGCKEPEPQSDKKHKMDLNLIKLEVKSGELIEEGSARVETLENEGQMENFGEFLNGSVETEPVMNLVPQELEPNRNLITREDELVKDSNNQEIEPVKDLVTEESEPVKELVFERSKSVKDLIAEEFELIKKLTEERSEPAKDSITQESEPVIKLAVKKSGPINKSTEERSEPVKKLIEEKSGPVQKLIEENSEPVKKLTVEKSEPVKKLTEEKPEPVKKLTIENPESVKNLTIEKSEPVKKLAEEKSGPVKNLTIEKSEPVKKIVSEKSEPVKNPITEKPKPVKNLITVKSEPEQETHLHKKQKISPPITQSDKNNERNTGTIARTAFSKNPIPVPSTVPVPSADQFNRNNQFNGNNHEKIDWYCKVCNIRTTSRKTLEEHFDGQKHRAAENLNRSSNPNPNPKPVKNLLDRPQNPKLAQNLQNGHQKREPAKELFNVPQNPKRAQNLLNRPQNRSPNPKPVNRKSPDFTGTDRLVRKIGHEKWLCTLCDAKCFTYKTLQDHLNGKTHRLNGSDLGLGPIIDTVLRPVRDPVPRPVKDPVLSPEFKCDLCDVKCGNYKSFQEHLNGKRHRFNGWGLGPVTDPVWGPVMDPQRELKCGNCEFRSWSEKDLEEHVWWAHILK